MDRFLDNGTKLYDFYEEFLVVCPKCASLGKVLIDEDEFAKLSNKKIEQNRNKFFGPRKFVCMKCLHRENGAQPDQSREQLRLVFRTQLWLEIECCGDRIWAYNFEHFCS
ncbi:MAG: hypothetical protein IPJ30_14245 [Acidobacteria bacterium]|nr:hypothetical protein [Acidobacteriota bacterium]